MLRILQFLYRIRAFILFVFLEVMAVWMIVSNNSPQGGAFFNSSNALVGSVLKQQADIVQFFSLAEANEALTAENAAILQQLSFLQAKPDSITFQLDSTFASTYQFRGARVIGSSLRFSQNYLTINKGSKDGIKPGMGIFNPEGVVGRVKAVSENYAVAFSLLNTGQLTSSKIKSTNDFATVQWDGQNSTEAKLLFVPRHVKVQEGDTVITSGSNSVFPEGILIGVISKISPDEKDPNYLDLTVKLSTDFNKVNYVYLVENTRFNELDSLYRQSEISNEY
ncbi:rod shape-determining protein MreC [Algoriphagus litoralis]|uniref:rod shape-determining protein MreC n=1 Tax=Algoriphagus litoralis TaxID=2202829 RepID=UPI000DB9B7E3|nr:rod shape-determining protein MreC [Algoriphagus litoralis]